MNNDQMEKLQLVTLHRETLTYLVRDLIAQRNRINDMIHEYEHKLAAAEVAEKAAWDGLTDTNLPLSK